MSYKYTVIIPVRGGSKSIPLKNIKPIAGRPLLFWSLDAAFFCKSVDHIYVSTDSKTIRDVVDKYIAEQGDTAKISCIDRNPSNATDNASTESVLEEFHSKVSFEHMILMQVTSPLVTHEDLDEAIKIYEDEKRDSLLTAVRQKRFIWAKDESGYCPANYDYMKRPRRQEFEGFLVENGAFYITSEACFRQSKCRISGNIGIYEMHENTYFEIDEPSDWCIVEKLLEQQLKLKKAIRDIKLFVTDCDGVMTDGGMYYTENGDEIKKFNTIDGKGIELLRNKGVITCIITGEESQIVSNRGAKLKIDYVFKGIENKLVVLYDLISKLDIQLSQVAYIGDDVNDIECIKAVGLGFAVPNATEEVKKIADRILKTEGGKGAVREAADIVCSMLGEPNG